MSITFFSSAELADLRKQLRSLLKGPPYKDQHECHPVSIEEQLWKTRNELTNMLQQLRTIETDEQRKQTQTKIQELREVLRMLMLKNRQKVNNRETLHVEKPVNQGEAVGDGWTSCKLDQIAIFEAVPGLWLKPGWRLYAYAYRMDDNSNGVVWALHKTAPEPSVLYEHNSSLFDPPCPNLAHSFAEALEGDGCPASYMRASILIREMEDFAALWHGVSWGTHEIVSILPKWVCNLEKTDFDLRPRVKITEEGEVVVIFYTTSNLGAVRLIKHCDKYCQYSYKPVDMVRQTIATGDPGYIH